MHMAHYVFMGLGFGFFGFFGRFRSQFLYDSQMVLWRIKKSVSLNDSQSIVGLHSDKLKYFLVV